MEQRNKRRISFALCWHEPNSTASVEGTPAVSKEAMYFLIWAVSFLLSLACSSCICVFTSAMPAAIPSICLASFESSSSFLISSSFHVWSVAAK